MPKVSIIIPVYGVEKYIERCARSLFEQTLDDIEYLFIDDCTPDCSLDILQQVLGEYPQRKSQVVIHRMEQNSGQAAVRKWGMQNATGEYVIHCDSDDWVDVNMYKAMYEKAVTNNADVVICDMQITDGEKTLKRIKGCYTTDKVAFIESLFFQKGHWSLCNKIFKRNLFRGVTFPNGNMGEDMALTLQLLLKCYRIAYVDKYYYFYFYNNKSITHIQNKEEVLNKYYQLSDNSKLVISAYIKENAYDLYKDGLEWLWFRAANALMPCISDPKIAMLWKKHFQGKHFSMLFNARISLLRKIRHLVLVVKTSFLVKSFKLRDSEE